MTTRFRASAAAVCCATLTTCAPNPVDRDFSVLSSAARQAYVYAAPMIENYKTMHRYAIDRDDPEYKAPFNQIANLARLATPDDTAVVTPNSDTPYSMVWLDLRAEPQVLSVPEIAEDRYYSVQLVDLYTQNFAYLGTRTTGNGAGDYVITGPRYHGPIPRGMPEIRAETEFVFAIYRTQLFGPEDLENVKAIQAQFKVAKLTAFANFEPLPAAPELEFPEYDPVAAHNANFIRYFNFLLQFCPTIESENELIDSFERVRIGPGRPFDAETEDRIVRTAIDAGVRHGRELIDDARRKVDDSSRLFGTRASLGPDYLLQRAVGAELGIYGNDREEAYYVVYSVDAAGEILDGQNRYSLHFGPDELPPVNAFWSITMYDGDSQLLVANEIDRYLINSTMLESLVRDEDGGLTIHMQSAPPEQDRSANWLPAPAAPFYAVLRLYWPKSSVLDGSWKAPQLQAIP